MANSPNSLTENVTLHTFGDPIVDACFLGRTAAFALNEGQVLLLDGGQEKRIDVHKDGIILVAARAGTALLTGGDDGRLMRTFPDGRTEEIAAQKGKWIDAVAGREDGAMAWSTGKQVYCRDAKGEVKTCEAPSTVRGLAFAAKGYRLGMTHYNGVSLWFPNTAAAPERFEWKGSHLDMTLSPDGRFVISTMQENALHGWRISDKANMRMSGYPSKTRSLSWSHDGNWLATSGAESCVIWPFKDKDGPMGKQPQECGVRNAKVSRVAFHPKMPIIAIGYEDGWVLLCRLSDAAEILVHGARQGAEGAITALAWDQNGQNLLFGAADGKAGLLAMPA
ncbi:WD40 repeat domain-containing protein [Beijerinckia indica]|uniref:WD-40 repeat protein n=1 Tax=Beijerinckia indica subsp. indica (strain ATCC 9039 / DSM 1715 / NCIMB 8712) TaxID=395963 RepID=B2IC80_BEII9|nr:hypothetical protein [Beijerinckia indica]ACB96677.1 WD-40 repeat protein [Beijerinckia indica subsp. indica ATCC 9039]